MTFPMQKITCLMTIAVPYGRDPLGHNDFRVFDIQRQALRCPIGTDMGDLKDHRDDDACSMAALFSAGDINNPHSPWQKNIATPLI